MKKWADPVILELDIKATAQQPCTIDSADDYANGKYKQGTRDGSGTSSSIIYYPHN